MLDVTETNRLLNFCDSDNGHSFYYSHLYKKNVQKRRQTMSFILFTRQPAFLFLFHFMIL